ncbi:hypothetical protein OAH87_04990 [Marinomonas sp.]|nr:hypothetical protein [Marinomonas sp.]MDB4837806.1 hypothetical protein [Marinomonas sp.]
MSSQYAFPCSSLSSFYVLLCCSWLSVSTGISINIPFLAPLQHDDTAVRVIAERAMNKHLNGGCQAPIACFAELQENTLWLRGLVGSPDGTTMLRSEIYGSKEDPETLGIQLADELIGKGAKNILDAIYQ